jgi:hypothetical protein
VTQSRSRVVDMVRDAARYMPAIGRARLLGSLYEIKTSLVQTEANDARPILFEESSASPRVISILGGKIDNIYDVLDVLDGHRWA